MIQTIKLERMAHAIYRFGDVRVIEILLKMLESNENSMQVSAIDVLAKIGTTQVVQPLLKLATKGEVNDVNYAAAKALGAINQTTVDSIPQFTFRR